MLNPVDLSTENGVKFTLPPPLKISDTSKDIVRSFLQFTLSGSGTGQTFFRRVERVVGRNLKSIAKITTPDQNPEYLQSLDGLTKEEINKNIQVTYDDFYGFTRTQMIRSEPGKLINKPLFFHSRNYRQIDTTLDLTFAFSEDRRLTKPVTPIAGDLLFVFLSNETLDAIADGSFPKKNPSADKWFIASEQFLRAYTAIMYDWHDSFDVLLSVPTEAPRDIREEALREKLFSGNRLMTNSWVKHKLALAASGKTMTQSESQERYWFIRSEYASKRWVDVWAAIVLISRYGELPCPVNIPNNKATFCKDATGIKTSIDRRVVWDMPANLVSSLLRNAGGFQIIKSIDDGSFEGCSIRTASLVEENTLENYDLWKSYIPSHKSKKSKPFWGVSGRGCFVDEIAHVHTSSPKGKKEHVFTKDVIENLVNSRPVNIMTDFTEISSFLPKGKNELSEVSRMRETDFGENSWVNKLKKSMNLSTSTVSTNVPLNTEPTISRGTVIISETAEMNSIVITLEIETAQ